MANFKDRYWIAAYGGPHGFVRVMDDETPLRWDTPGRARVIVDALRLRAKVADKLALRSAERGS